jgi:cell division septum initiation protein DivIVA
MDFDNNNVNFIEENFDIIKERHCDDIGDNATIIKQNCKIVTGDMNIVITQTKKEKIKSDKIVEKEKIKADKIIEKERIKADKIAEKEKNKADKIIEKEKIKADKIAEKEKNKADKIAEKEKIKADKIVGIKKNKKKETIINLDNQQKENDVKVKGRPRIEYNVKIVTEINDNEQQDYNFLEVEEYCTEVTIDGVIYYRDRNMVLYDYETHEEI